MPDQPGIASAVLSILGEKGINVRFIVQCIDLRNRSHIVLCVTQDDLEAALLALKEVKPQVQAEEVTYHPNVAIVSVFGPHFQDNPGIASIAFLALASVGINILAISTSISTLSCVLDGNRVTDAVSVLREAFDVPTDAIFTASCGLSLRSRVSDGKR